MDVPTDTIDGFTHRDCQGVRAITQVASAQHSAVLSAAPLATMGGLPYDRGCQGYHGRQT